ncbi:MAG: serine/threonine protein kinase [Yoonia sp.]|uniref:serine/threonine protein kinase n=1 Tax=Yoonia sp. TaxID=2212373 RepID=UPI003EF4CDD2
MAKVQPKDATEDGENFVDELKPGTKLMHGQYTIESFLNAGGFGITYLAKDSLDRKVVIKECFPGAFCRRSRYVVQARSRAHQNELQSIVRLFVQEARSLAKLDHPNIVGVHHVFEDNDTAYMALDYVTGRDLLDIIEDPNDNLTPTQTKSILKEVLGAVGFIHDQGILHRDISPDNILINEEFRPILIDFGAAREEATKQSRVLSALRVVKDGYSPQEFYIAGSEQSPSSDLYALAASFHHLITGDVPPNSQARLAAIASGDADPYVKTVGRFPDYDDNFLKALDKALEVLPKDRVQSAKDWIRLIDGLDGNVTPLNPGVATAKDAAKPSKTLATAPAKKSKMPVLLGSAAAVALLVGVGVMTMGGGDDAPVVEAPVAEAPAVEAPAVETTAVETPAPVTAPAADPAPETVVAEEAAPVEEAPAVIAAVEEALAEPEAAPVIEAPAPVILEEPAPAENVATPAITNEPAAQDSAGSDVAVAGPAADVLTPDVRPATRPEPVELAVVPEPVPLPEPVSTPTLAVDDAVTPQLGTVPTANAPTPDGETQQFALPNAPIIISTVGNGPAVDILAVTPGNEIVTEEPEPVAAPIASAATVDVGELVSSNWTVRLPFTAVEEGSSIIGAAGPIAPSWVQPGVEITSINGVSVNSIAQIPLILRAVAVDATSSPTMNAVFGTVNPDTGEASSQAWVLPVVQRVQLENGPLFETVFAGFNWRTTVIDTTSDQGTGLEVGDVITSYIPTSEAVDGRDTIFEIFNRELVNGTEQFPFAVQRDGSLWVANYAYPGATQ